ncbi:MAG: tryptophan 7-halogenase [Candidatus Cybelea sp.]
MSSLSSGNGSNADCIVVGAGPAGSTAATLIALQGHRVLLIEKSDGPAHKIGESLLPSTVHGICPLLGVEKEIAEAGFILKRGGTFRWGKRQEPWTFDFAASQKMAGPTSTAFQVERIVFDKILLDNAERRGVQVRRGCRVSAPVYDGERVVGLEFVNESGNTETWRAPYTIDASGYQSTLSRRVGERIYSKYFQNIAVFGYYRNGKRLPSPNSGNIFCAAFEDGWFWYIPLRSDLTSVGVVLDKSRAVINSDLAQTLFGYVDKCRPIKDLLAEAERVTDGIYGEVRARQDYSYTSTRFWAPGIVCIGDAACFVDPVFSSGVHLATYSALLAARSVNTRLRGELDDEASFGEFESRYRHEYANFYDFLLAFYDLDQDLSSYFWEAKKITHSAETEEQAFINLVGGVGEDGEATFDTTSFFEARKNLGQFLFEEGNGKLAPPKLGSKSDFYRKLTSEITQLQIQAQLGGKRPIEKPLFPNGLVPSRDGFHWSRAAVAPPKPQSAVVRGID